MVHYVTYHRICRCRFTVSVLVQAFPRIKYIIDLTNTDRYYDEKVSRVNVNSYARSNDDVHKKCYITFIDPCILILSVIETEKFLSFLPCASDP